jgi:hypothetical protein
MFFNDGINRPIKKNNLVQNIQEIIVSLPRNEYQWLINHGYV